MIELSNHKASMARACWMKYKFYAIDGLKPIRKSRALTLGEVVHSAFDQMYQGALLNVVLQRIVDSYDSAIKLSAPEETEDLKVDKMTALGMVEFYPLQYSKFEEIEPEVEFRVSLGHGIRLIGRVDGKIKEHGKRWIREMKTTALAEKQFKGRALVSYQASGYKYGLEWAGDKYEGVMFDYLRKPRLYKRNDDNAESFGKRIYEDYALTKTHEAKRKSYFGRFYVYRNDFEMECFKSDMLALGKEIRRRTNNYRRRSQADAFPRNPDACYLYNKLCEYSTICWKRNNGGQAYTDLVKAYFVNRSDEKKETETIINTEDSDNGTT